MVISPPPTTVNPGNSTKNGPSSTTIRHGGLESSLTVLKTHLTCFWYCNDLLVVKFVLGIDFETLEKCSQVDYGSLGRQEKVFFIDNVLVRIHFIIVMIRWAGLAPWEFKSTFPGSLTSTILVWCQPSCRNTSRTGPFQTQFWYHIKQSKLYQAICCIVVILSFYSWCQELTLMTLKRCNA